MIKELLDTSPIGLAIVSLETKKRVFVNQSLVKMFGAGSVNDLMSRPVSESWVDPDQYRETRERLAAGENLVDFQCQRYRLDGSKWWVLMNTGFTEFDGMPAHVGWHVDITEMVEARAAVETANNELEARVRARTLKLQETEQRFRDYAEIASDWFWEMDSQLRYTFISETYEKIAGKPPKNLIGRTRRDMYKGQYPQEREAWLNLLDTLDAHQDFDNFTFTYRRDDGSECIMSNSGRAIFDPQGRFMGYRGVGFDVTDRLWLQNQLEEQQAQLLAFSENSPTASAIVDTDGKYVLANKYVCDHFGLAPEQVIGKTVREIYSPDEAPAIEAQIRSVAQSGKAQQYENTVAHADGSIRTYLSDRFPIRTSDGVFKGVGSVSIDITDRKTVEETLRESEARYQMIVDMQSELLTRFTPDWKLTFVNRAYCEFVNDTEENLVGTDMFADAPKDVVPRLISYFQAFTPDRPIQKNENQLLRFDGELRDMEWSNYAQFDSDGNIISYQSVGRDVTEQRQAQRDLIRANEKAQEASRAKSNFLSTMSHEIRTPLNGVLGLAQLLTDSDLDQEQRKKVDTILSSGQTLLSIINDVLDMSKIEAGGLELEETTFSLKELVSVIATPFQSLADDKGIRLRVIDSVDRGMMLKGDPVRVRQILWNLLSNAVKFTHQGEVKLTLREVDGKDQPSYENPVQRIAFVVEDTGAGIAPERLHAIFDAFTQEDTSISRKFGGTGLGLSIVKQLTDMMGGSVTAESEIAKGSTFTVTLPFALLTPEETQNQELAEEPEVSGTAARLRILVAEDNPVNAMIAKSFLEKFGHQVQQAENGRIAVSLAEQGWADLILMDIHMPEMDGIEATRTIRQADWGATLPIIGLTAEAFAERHALFRKAGMNDVLTKPFTERQLAITLNKFGQATSRSQDPVQGKPPPADTAVKEMPVEEMPAQKVLPVGDDLQFENLRQQMPPDAMASLLEQAKASLVTRMQDLHEGVERADSLKIREAAHSIKGSCGSMFASRIAALAALAEQNHEDVAVVRQQMPDLEAAMEKTLDWWQTKQEQA